MMQLIKLFLFLILFAVGLSAMAKKQQPQTGKIDDWEYNATMPAYNGKHARIMPTGVAVNARVGMPTPMLKSMRMSTAPDIGFAVGGAKDANNFYDNLKNGYLPKLKSITYEGVFYEHYFDTDKKSDTKCETLFCPAYATAVQKNLYTDETEYYLSVGLNSNIKASDFARKKLNLVVVLDISGSMSSPFNSYYYDKKRRRAPEENSEKSKMQIASESLAAMLRHLRPEDSLGVVLFDSRAYTAKPLRAVAQTDMEAIKKHILDLKPRGGTNWSAGYEAGLELFRKLDENAPDRGDYENRIIFMTDAMPNRGELRENGLFGMVDKAAKRGVYTSFIGIGVDFNTDLMERVSKTRGANYYAVHSLHDFKKRLDDEFDFMVTPLVFDLKLALDSDAYDIEAVYGSPEADKATKTVLYVNTLFPSATKEGKTKGGIIVVKLKRKGEGNALTLRASYKDRNGKTYNVSKKAAFKEGLYFDNSGIRKGILLSEYVTLIQNWLIDSRKGCNDKLTPETPVIIPFYRQCMRYPPERPEYKYIETWERRSCPLEVSDGYRNVFALFRRKFGDEMRALNDPSLHREYDALKLLSGYKKHKPASSGQDDWQTER
ncbi:MAG: hypothetical protein DSZ05_05225 [Sulfurospirillum sp.]|nr:MAG: hypothetical protein DSZ05_05225 [Sulfurospirillum sp.]